MESQSATSTDHGPENRPSPLAIESFLEDHDGEHAADRRFRAVFEKDLSMSRVYKHVSCNHSQSSLVSSTARSTTLSTLSGLTLGQISSVSVFALPVCSSDIVNSQHYQFGDIFHEALEKSEADTLRIMPRVPTTKPQDTIVPTVVIDHQSEDTSQSSRSSVVDHVSAPTPRFRSCSMVLILGNSEKIASGCFPGISPWCGIFLKAEGKLNNTRYFN